MPAFTPEFFHQQFTDAGQTKAIAGTQMAGQILITNNGPNVVYINFTAAPPAAAAFGDDKKSLQVRESLNLNGVSGIVNVSGKCAAGETADVEIVVIPHTGGSGIL